MGNFITEVGNKLNLENINFEEFVLSNSVHTVEDVAKECKCQPSQVVKTMLFVGKKNPVLILLSGNNRVNKNLLESFLKQKIKMATPEQVRLITAFEVGAVSPFLISASPNIISLADESLLENDKLYMGSGQSMVLILMTSLELKKAFTGEFIGIT